MFRKWGFRYTSSSAAYNNLCEDNREEGIFVEETASGNFIFNNTVRRNGCGIGVYSMAVGPVCGDFDMTLVLATFHAVPKKKREKKFSAPCLACDVHFPQHTAPFVAC